MFDRTIDDRHNVLGAMTCRSFQGVLAVLLSTLMLGLVLFAALAVIAPRSLQANQIETANGAAETTAGLFFRSGQADSLFEAPRVASDVEIRVAGQVSRVKVRQLFSNPSDAWLEGVYVFPLPERAAVDRLTMVIGERRIEGEILPREQARQVYEQAAAQGKRASLLSGARPNVFVASVANVGPGDSIEIEIEYQDRVAYRDGRFALRFPMVVAPRYTPGDSIPLAKAPGRAPQRPQGQPIAHEETPEMPKVIAGRDLFGPVRHPDSPTRNHVTLQVRLDAGLALASVDSPSHAVTIDEQGKGRRLVTLDAGSVPADRDFVLEWRPQVGAVPEAALFAEEIDGETYLMASVLPPAADELDHAAPVPPRDLILVVDTSGSMHGPSIEAAREALRLALDGLRAEDRFNLIRFDDDTRVLFPEVQPATPRHLALARRAVRGLEAEGGTEMQRALLEALDTVGDEGASDAERLRQVVFITDGAVGNEHQLFLTIAEKLGESRLFTVGIGSAPNGYFMRKAAELGRGSFVTVGRPDQAAARMAALLRKLEQPALTDLAAAWPLAAGKDVALAPNPIPDLYAGEPVTFAARLPGVALADLEGALLLTAKRGAEAWQRRVPLTGIETAPGVAAVWARAELSRIEDGLYQGQDPEAVRAAALALALKHRLVTRHTSLVAVDPEIVRPDEAPLASAEVPRDLPAGWDAEKVFGNAAELMPLRVLPEPLMREASLRGRSVSLPATATPATQLALSGLGLIALGAFLMIVYARLRRAAGAAVA